MVDKIQAWVESHKKDAHYAAAGIAFLYLAYFQSPTFHDYVTHLFGLLPQSLKELFATVVSLVMLYRSTKKAAAS